MGGFFTFFLPEFTLDNCDCKVLALSANFFLFSSVIDCSLSTSSVLTPPLYPILSIFDLIPLTDLIACEA